MPAWTKIGRPMERTLAGDLKFAAALLAGVVLAVLLGLGEWSQVLAVAATLVVLTLIFNVMRAAQRRR